MEQTTHVIGVWLSVIGIILSSLGIFGPERIKRWEGAIRDLLSSTIYFPFSMDNFVNRMVKLFLVGVIFAGVSCLLFYIIPILNPNITISIPIFNIFIGVLCGIPILTFALPIVIYVFRIILLLLFMPYLLLDLILEHERIQSVLIVVGIISAIGGLLLLEIF